MSRAAAMRSDLATAMKLPVHMVGGGQVIRPFYDGKRQIKVGTTLTGDEIRALPAANRQALLGRFIAVWPQSSGGGVASRSPDDTGTERHVVALGFGRGYRVIEGREISEKPLSREEAFALAGKPDPSSH